MSEPKRKPDDRVLTAELFAQVLTHHPFLLDLKGTSPARSDFVRLLWAIKDSLESYVDEFFLEGANRG
jgi:hypothetical protein